MKQAKDKYNELLKAAADRDNAMMRDVL